MRSPMPLELRDPSSGSTFQVPDEGLTIGREGGKADFQVKDNGVSKSHCRIYLDGDAWFLMVEYVVEILPACVRPFHADGGRCWPAAAIGHAHRDHRRDAVGMEQRGVPCDAGAPVVADDDRFLRAIGVDQADNIGGGLVCVIGLYGGGLVGLAIAAHVWRDDSVSSGGDGGNLMPPGIPALRPAMDEHDQRPLPHLGDPQRDPVGFDHAEGDTDDGAGRCVWRSGAGCERDARHRTGEQAAGHRQQHGRSPSRRL